MGWREAEERAKKAEQEVRDHSDEYHHLTKLGSGSLNASGIVNRIVDSESFPGTEPERTWVRDWDTMEETIEDFSYYSSKHLEDMNNYTKFRGFDINRKLPIYLNALAQYRPTLISILGIESLFKRR